MPDIHEEARALVAQVAAELAECRQRGIERLDRHSHNQAPVRADALQRLAVEYVAARQLPVHGRIAQIKLLLRRALEELDRQGDEADAVLIRNLFFGDSANVVMQSAGELLEIAQRRMGEHSETRFRERRNTACQAFAEFLIEFVTESCRDTAGSIQPSAIDSRRIIDVSPEGSLPPQSPPGPDRHQVLTGYVEHGERFITLLAEATNVTIVGFTNEQLAEMLEVALQRKRHALARPDAFWGSLRIVYLSDRLLDFINDERSEYPDRRESLRQRRLAAVYGRRSVSVFLRRIPTFRWALYESSQLPPFIGTLFEMPSGKRLVQLLIRRPQRSTPDHLFMELEDLPDQYFTAAFEDVVYNSVNDSKTVPIGLPADGGFRCTGTRYRQNVLADGSYATGWLPVVLVVTYQRRADQVQPVLQLRSEGNAARELNRLSHLSGHIHQPEDFSLDRRAASWPKLLDIGHEIPMRAAQRRVQMETGDDPPPALRPVGTGSYLHHDKEHLFFFIFALELPDEFQFSRRNEMHRVPLPELFPIRENQALRKALLLCRSTGLSARIWSTAAEIVALNLVLHDHADIAQRLIDLSGRSDPGFEAVVAMISESEERTRQSWFSGSREVEIMGLSGLQYREFFTIVLPLYAEAGVSGASDQLARIQADEGKSAAVDRLAALYGDDSLMSAIPVEL